STVTLNRGGSGGTLTLGSLYFGNARNLTLLSGDRINSGDNGVNVTHNATLTTASSSNILANAVNVNTGGTLKLGAAMNLNGIINVRDSGSTFDAQNH